MIHIRLIGDESHVPVPTNQIVMLVYQGVYSGNPLITINHY